MKALHNMDDEEFMDAWDKASEAAQSAKEKVKEFAAEHERRLNENAARESLEAMSDSQRAALAQVMKADGIESRETVNG
jgi:hypothetical protein